MVQCVDIQYLRILEEILQEGTLQEDRTSVGSSIQTFGKEINFDTKGRYVPFIQHRSFGTKTSFHEWIWMMRGDTNTKYLTDNNVHIWDEHSSREFLDSRGLYDVPTGHIGKSYGYQFRNFSGKVDQLDNVVESLKNDKGSRRHTIFIWNPAELNEAPLAPCSYLYEFMVEGDQLHLYQHMRSADVFYGVPYNMSFGTYFLFAMAAIAGKQAGKYKLTMTNAHIYKNQVSLVEEVLDRGFNSLTPCPMMRFNKKISSVKDLEQIRYTDFIIDDFVKGQPIKNVPLAV